jgi:hypothetical protein
MQQNGSGTSGSIVLSFFVLLPNTTRQTHTLVRERKGFDGHQGQKGI